MRVLLEIQVLLEGKFYSKYIDMVSVAATNQISIKSQSLRDPNY